MSEKVIVEAIGSAENNLATTAANLVDWFSGREIPENHTGKCVVEKMYVSSLLKKISEDFDRIEVLTAQLVEYRKDLF